MFVETVATMVDPDQIGYCTNVHSGSNLEEVKSNLERYSVPIKQEVSPDDTMPIGLWLSHAACQEALVGQSAVDFQEWLESRGLLPYTFNAFPFHDFHQPIVKHKVYLPTWADSSRLDYTVAIAELQSKLLGKGKFGTISTLPLGWPSENADDFYKRCADQLIQCAIEFVKIREATGCHLFLCIEPEPGCCIDTSSKLIRFFEQHLFNNGQICDAQLRQHLGVCHDICHSAVMFEPQQLALASYQEAGVHVGKVQVSSAIEADFNKTDSTHVEAMLNLLEQFAEERYLHQTCVKESDEAVPELWEDLPPALVRLRRCANGMARVHFHVPVFLDSIGHLGTTNDQIAECFFAMPENDIPTHIEVETYAWSVLPADYQAESLVAGIRDELTFVRQLCVA